MAWWREWSRGGKLMPEKAESMSGGTFYCKSAEKLEYFVFKEGSYRVMDLSCLWS